MDPHAMLFPECDEVRDRHVARERHDLRGRNEVDEAFARANIDRDAVVDPKNRKPFHPGVTFAVAEALGPVSSYTGFWAMRREGERFVPVDLAGATPFLPSHFSEEYRKTVLDWARSSGFFQKQA